MKPHETEKAMIKLFYHPSRAMQPTRRDILLMAGTFCLSMALPDTGMATDKDFLNWIKNFRKTALEKGITAEIYAQAFSGITSPDPEVLKKASFQPEFTDPAWNYFDNRINETSIANGRRQARKWARQLARIEKRFGVSRNILLAIWSLETNYGEVMKREDIMRDAIRSLATLAYADPKRSNYGRKQLIAAMKILQRGIIERAYLTGSWAGAMGHTQFIPTSYLAYSVDMEGRGQGDIWNSVPDALASAANLLARNGWQTGRTWGYEVVLPVNRKYPDGTLTIAEWRKLGVRRATGQNFPDRNDKAVLKLPDGDRGPAFLVIQNFFTLKRYNNSDRYALAVGLLADRIGGHSRQIRDWNRPFIPVTAQQRKELQKRLHALGYYNGEIDGKIGATSRKAIMEFQRKNGLDPDGYPSRKLLSTLRKH